MGKKRKYSSENGFGIGETLANINGSTDKPESQNADSKPDEDGWQVVQHRSKKPKHDRSYPEFVHSPNSRLQSQVSVSNLQSLILYLLADGIAPQWISVKNRTAVKKVVVLMVPGLEAGMFHGTIDLEPPSDNGPADTVGTSEVQGQQASNPSSDNGAPTCTRTRKFISPDEYYPVKLEKEILPSVLQPLADIFPHIWPVKAPGDDKYSRVFSPLQAVLTAHIPKSQEDKKLKGPKPPRASASFQPKRTPITAFIGSLDQLIENDFVIHPAMLQTEQEKEDLKQRREKSKTSSADGWVDTNVNSLEEATVPEDEYESGSMAAGHEILAIDCEMCMTGQDQFELTRVSVVDWHSKVVMDELVKPNNPITNYLTPYSGMTKEKLDSVTTRLEDVQKRLISLITPRTILVGHSLNADLTALKMTHPFIVDTTITYPHSRGPPLKNALKFLASKYLGKEIQKQHGVTGHDSIEDACAALELARQKCEKGPQWGTSEVSSEAIFARLGRSPRPANHRANPTVEEFRKGAVVDWGNPRKGHGNAAELSIGCGTDEEVVAGVQRAVSKPSEDNGIPIGGLDFVWARFKELEAVRGWWNEGRSLEMEKFRREALKEYQTSGSKSEEDGAADASRPINLDPGSLAKAVGRTVANITKIYESLPACTAFIVYSGTGDPRDLVRMQGLHQTFKREYQVKKWDQLSVKWTDTEDQALKAASRTARNGIGFMVVK
ncbi:exonuclease [Eremomyces bilateralis CBS 781.70]|uniref:Exonuclease n=1 Tax=Eremomyces bilateralis CBS 781.70 TaxID=1392243 RepID=A0A6G1G662_9PEZI|nr:exonuclease [Eremomyces bilateralis CBS 781.70]KAF1813585.1 exonuclease [Eremomyces bilateralis CBS 781.70]